MESGFDSFQKTVHPNNLFDLVSPKLLTSMMHGFFLSEHTGVILISDQNNSQKFRALCPVRENEPYEFTEQEYEKEDSEKYGQYQCLFCSEFRKNKESRKACFASDESNVKKLFNSNENSSQNDRLTTTECHMGLTEFLFPIFIGNERRAVFMTGQKITEGESLDNVFTQIDNNFSGEGRESARGNLRKIAQKSIVSPKIEKKFTEKFRTFCETVQKMVTALYEAQLETATAQVSNNLHEQLSKVLFDDNPQSWWKSLGEIVDTLRNVSGLQRIIVLARKESRYLVKAVSGDSQVKRDTKIPVRHFWKIPRDKLISIEKNAELFPVLQEQLGISVGDGTLYRLELFADQPLSTLITLEGNVKDYAKKMVLACCRTIAARSDTFSLIQSSNDQRKQFIESVTFSGHWLKTPLQNIMFAVSAIEEFHNQNWHDASEINSLIAEIKNNLRMAVFDVQAIHSRVTEKRDIFDAQELLKEIIDNEKRHAEYAETPLKSNLSSRPCSVFADRQKIKIAISNLVVNALKYADAGTEIIVSCELPDRYRMSITISNQGDDLASAIKKRLGIDEDERAEGSPARPKSKGWGIGLTQSQSFVEEFGGTFDVDSVKIGEKFKSGKQRFVNRAIITLPLRYSIKDYIQ